MEVKGKLKWELKGKLKWEFAAKIPFFILSAKQVVQKNGRMRHGMTTWWQKSGYEACVC